MSDKYESEFAVMPLAKLMCIPMVVGTLILPNVILFQKEAFSETLPFACAVSTGAMTVALMIRMSMLRAEMNFLDSRKLIESTDRFKRWSTCNLNNAEYYPMFMILLFARQVLQDNGKPLSSLGIAGCFMTIFANYGFVLTSACYGDSYFLDSPVEKVLRKIGFARLWRIFPVLVRYMALIVLLVDMALSV